MAAVLVTVVPAGSAATAEPQGAAASGSTYTALSPTRVLDTRAGGGPIGAGGTTTIDLAGSVPASATAVVFTLTGTEPTADTHLTVSPHGEDRPEVSNLNLRAGETRANLVTAAVGADRVLDLYNNEGSTHVIADLAGYYATGTGARFLPARPSRVLAEPVGAGSTTTLDLAQTVPASATAVVLNVTAANATADTYVTAWPAGGARPNASTVNVPAGGTNPGLTTVALGAGQSVTLYNNAGRLDLVVDLQGFYTPEFGAVFTPVTPQRVFDTRNGTGVSRPGPIGPQDERGVYASALPSEAIGAVVNITGIEPTADTYVTAWQANRFPPETSNLNLGRGRTAANLAVVETRYNAGQFRFFAYNNAGDTDIAMDLAGYFSVPPAPCAHDCAFTWGGNHGQLGNATTTGSSRPQPLHGLSGVVSVAARTAALADGSVWTWGTNWFGNLGHGWHGAAIVPFPLRVPGIDGVVAVADTSGGTHYALRSDGTVWSWGIDADGALGTGGVSPFPSRPQQVSGLANVTAIAAGSSTGYALRGDGTVWAWGWNHEGQLGTGSTAGNSAVPVQVPGLTDVVRIAAGGNNAFAVTSDGALRAWGVNRNGTLGNGTTGGLSRVPVRVAGLTGVVAVAGDGSNSYAVLADGSVWSWGWSGFAGLGDGTDSVDVFRNVPGRVDGISGAVDVVSHTSGGQVLDSSGRLWMWGWNSDGDLGVGQLGVPALRPVQGPTFAARVTALGDGGQALVPTP
ncbi:RCC1 domain-containing protein [Actinosynnema sp. NPDC091369]